MTKRVFDLRDQIPLLDVVSYGRGGGTLTPSQRSQIGSLSRQSNESLPPDFLRQGYSGERPW
jgi:hypothetical protein